MVLETARPLGAPIVLPTAPLNASNLQPLVCSEGLKNERIRSFVASQARFMKTHAKEGRTIGASQWDPDAPPRPQAHQISGFDTPILKPRAPQAQPPLPPSPPLPQPSSHVVPEKSIAKDRDAPGPRKKKISPTNHHTDKQSPDKKLLERSLANERAEPSKTNGRPEIPKKRAAKSDTDDEHAQRLADRRERKRIKRAMMKPSANSDLGSEVEESGKKKFKKAGKAKNNAQKLPAGFALMHGLSSTNVGKNRLTILPSIGIGVFNKGKASAKTKVTDSQRARPKGAANIFSEDRFLGKTNTKTLQTIEAKSRKSAGQTFPAKHDHAFDSGSSDTSSDADTDSVVKPLPGVQVLKKPITVKGKPKVQELSPVVKEQEDEDDEGSMAACTQRAREKSTVGEAARSESWVIESPTRSLPSASGGSVSIVRSKVGTAVLDVRCLRWGGLVEATPAPTEHVAAGVPDCIFGSVRRSRREDGDSAARRVREREESLTADANPCSSLGPSESASQVAQRQFKPFSAASLSKYFDPAPSSSPPRRVFDQASNIHSVHRELASPRLLEPSDLVLSPPCASPPRQEQTTVRLPQDVDVNDTSFNPSPRPSTLNSLDRALEAFVADDFALRYAVKHPKRHPARRRRPGPYEPAVLLDVVGVGEDVHPSAGQDLYDLADDDLFPAGYHFRGDGSESMTSNERYEDDVGLGDHPMIGGLQSQDNGRSHYDHVNGSYYMDLQHSKISASDGDDQFSPALSPGCSVMDLGYSPDAFYNPDSGWENPWADETELECGVAPTDVDADFDDDVSLPVSTGGGSQRVSCPDDFGHSDDGRTTSDEGAWHPTAGVLLSASGVVGQRNATSWRGFQPQTVHGIEEDVARAMKDHWLPQRV